jgi:hypothetical protein
MADKSKGVQRQRVWTEGGGLNWAFLDSDWLKGKARQTMGIQAAGERTPITAKGTAVAEFLKKFGADESAYSGEMKRWARAEWRAECRYALGRDETMRYPAMILALAGAALLTGCSSLISVNPFVEDGQTAGDPALVGTWKAAAPGDKGQIAIEQRNSVYAIRFEADGKTLHLEGRLTRVGDAELMDVVSTEEHDLAIPVHLAVRLWPSANSLKWAYLDSDWIRAQAKQALATQPSDGNTLITSLGGALAQFLKKYGADPRAYSGSPDQLVRAQ